MENKWTDRQYHVQDNDDVAHPYVRTYCNTNQLSALPFVGPHSKPHDTWVLSKHYHFSHDLKLCNGICATSVYHVLVMHVHQFYTKPGYLVYHQMNKSAINL